MSTEAEPAPAKPGRSTAWREGLREARLDLALGALGMLFGSVSLAYPFGRDQGLYFYVGREWLERGALPYLGSFDVKTPGIYALHALLIALFGERFWAIRLAELACVAALGALAAGVAAPRGEAPRPGVRGAAVLGASVVYYGFFDFWNTAQCELWAGAFSLAGLWCARRARSLPRGAALAGLWCGLALLMKPPALWSVLVVAALLAHRAWEGERQGRLARVAGAAARFGAAGALVGLALLGYYALHRGALAALYDVLVRNNRHYVTNGRWVSGWEDMHRRSFDVWRSFDPLASVLAQGLGAGVLAGLLRRDRALVARHALPLVLGLCVLAGVVMQLKFAPYHWGLVVAPAALAVAVLVGDASALAERAGNARRALAPALCAANLLLLFYLTGAQWGAWWNAVKHTARWASGRETEQAFEEHFTVTTPYPYSWARSVELGRWLSLHSRPRDVVAIRGFEPQLYALSRRRFVGRFFWTTFLLRPEWAYRIEQWREEDRQVFVRTPPRFVLALEMAHTGPDAAEYFAPLGYRPVHRLQGFLILEHPNPTPLP